MSASVQRSTRYLTCRTYISPDSQHNRGFLAYATEALFVPARSVETGKHSLLAARRMQPQPGKCATIIHALNRHNHNSYAASMHATALICRGHQHCCASEVHHKYVRKSVLTDLLRPLLGSHSASIRCWHGSRNPVQCESGGSLACRARGAAQYRLVARCATRLGLLGFLLAIFAAGAASVWLAPPRALGCTVTSFTSIFFLSTIHISAITGSSFATTAKIRKQDCNEPLRIMDHATQ